MSHTFHTNRVTIHYNADFSGDATIRELKSGQEMKVPAMDLVDWVAHHYVRNKLMERLESADTEALLSGCWKKKDVRQVVRRDDG